MELVSGKFRTYIPRCFSPDFPILQNCSPHCFHIHFRIAKLSHFLQFFASPFRSMFVCLSTPMSALRFMLLFTPVFHTCFSHPLFTPTQSFFIAVFQTCFSHILTPIFHTCSALNVFPCSLDTNLVRAEEMSRQLSRLHGSRFCVRDVHLTVPNWAQRSTEYPLLVQ